ncbi:MAG: hypothetical protein PHI85_01495 [Victivallaceae bacterium]|nr:hypothetical protein [Victivallaceae bacterium]
MIVHWNKWGMIPSLMCMAATAALLAVMFERGGDWPLHANADGAINRTGPVGFGQCAIILIQAAFILPMAMLDEVMLKAASRRWNISGAISGFMCGVTFSAVGLLFVCGIYGLRQLPSWSVIWMPTAFGLIVALLSYLLEFLRKYPENRDTAMRAVQPDFRGTGWVCYERVTVPAIDLMLIVIAVIMVMSMTQIYVGTGRIPLPLLVSNIVVAAVFLVVGGGFTMAVAPGKLLVTTGWLKIPLFRLDPATVVNVEAVRINPLRDFGGWLWRPGSKATGLIAGNRGVRFELPSGKKVTVSLKNPELMVAALKAAGAQVLR